MVGFNERPASILWITLDATRQDRLSCYHYSRDTTPFLRKMSDKSIVFENAIVNAPWTFPSVGSMFTGLYPSQHNLKGNLKDTLRSITIAQLLARKGYETALITTNPWIVFSNLRKGFNKIVDVKTLFSRQSRLLRRGYDLIQIPEIIKNGLLIKDFCTLIREATEKTICRYTRAKRPFFCYVHLMEAHLPYTPPLKCQKFNKRKILSYFFERKFGLYSKWQEKRIYSWAGAQVFSPAEYKIMADLYDGCLFYLDCELGKYFDFLANMNLLDNTLVIITSDHGELLGEGGKIGHQFSCMDPLIKVPLIIYYPKLKSKRVHGLVETRNIFHIILNILDGNYDDFFSVCDYVFGEWDALPHQARAVHKVNPNTFISAQYIRTKMLKYVVYDTGEKRLYSLKAGEKELNDFELKKVAEELMNIKKRSIFRGAKMFMRPRNP